LRVFGAKIPVSRAAGEGQSIAVPCRCLDSVDRKRKRFAGVGSPEEYFRAIQEDKDRETII
jgi:hypothetical protein